VYRDLLAGPALCADGDSWLASHHDAVTAILRDDRLGHAQAAEPPDESLPDCVQRTMFIVRNPPEHTHLRGLVARSFTPRTVRELRPAVEALTEQLLDGLQDRDGAADLIADFAALLPVTVIADMFAVPEADRADFRRWSEDLVVPDGSAKATQLDRRALAAQAFAGFLTSLVEHRRRRPGPDLVSMLVAASDADAAFAQSDVVATCQLLLFAGHETTVNLFGNGILALLRHPTELQRLAAGNVSAQATVEELLRYDGPVHLTARTVLAPVTIGGVDLEPGSYVTVLLGAANRDPRRFEHPDRLDLARPNNQHVAFGSGIHFCLGATLARMEAHIALPALLARFPDLTLASDQLTWRHSLMLRGLTALPVTW